MLQYTYIHNNNNNTLVIKKNRYCIPYQRSFHLYSLTTTESIIYSLLLY